MVLVDRDFVQSLRRLWQKVEFLDAGEEFSHPVSLSPSGDFIQLSLDDSTSYEELYLCGLRNRDYNILLSGYSYLQFSKSSDALRYAFYPNPFLGSSGEALSEIAGKREYVDEGIISLEEYLHEVSELRFPVQSPPIRYDFDPGAYVDLHHPSSHFHIGFHGDNRWGACRIFSPEAFGLWVLKLYFGEKWRADKKLALGGVEYTPEELLARARRDTLLLDDNMFSMAEASSFHIN